MVLLFKGHLICDILTTAAVKKYLQHNNYKFFKETLKILNFSIDFLKLLKATLKLLTIKKIVKNYITFKKFINSKIISLKIP